MAPSSSTSSSNAGSDVERRHSTSKHKRKEKSHKKTKKRYKHRSDDDERGYKKFKRRKEKRDKRDRKDSSDEEMKPKPGPSVAENDKGEGVQKSEESNHDSIPAAAVGINQVENKVVDTYGPALPPHLKKSVEKSPPATPKVIGPIIPAHLLNSVQNHDNAPDPVQSEPEVTKSDDEEVLRDTVGPLPGLVNPELEERALEIKLGHVSASGSQSQNDEKARDEWMLELPEVKGVPDLGLTARQFRTKDRPDFSDRSQWTDTPEERERKKQGKPSAKDVAKEEARQHERQVIANRDAEQEKVAKEHKKKHKRDKSLMELHEKKLKKAKKEKEEPDVRRPFDRNVDLAANRFDEAQKKSIIKKAQLLDTRFSSGASKFL